MLLMTFFTANAATRIELYGEDSYLAQFSGSYWDYAWKSSSWYIYFSPNTAYKVEGTYNDPSAFYAAIITTESTYDTKNITAMNIVVSTIQGKNGNSYYLFEGTATAAGVDYELYLTSCPQAQMPSSEPHEHSYSAEWSHDLNTHWHACTSEVGDCDTPKADEAAHDCVNPQEVCSVCGFVKPSWSLSDAFSPVEGKAYFIRCNSTNTDIDMVNLAYGSDCKTYENVTVSNTGTPLLITANGDVYNIKMALSNKYMSCYGGGSKWCVYPNTVAWPWTIEGTNGSFTLSGVSGKTVKVESGKLFYDNTNSVNTASFSLIPLVKVTYKYVTVAGGEPISTSEGYYKSGDSYPAVSLPTGYSYVSGLPSGTISSEVALGDDIVLEIIVEQPTYVVTLAAGANGTVAFGDDTTGTMDVLGGNSATVKATANSGYEFDYWSVDGNKVSEDNPYTFTVTDNVTITANFKVFVPEKTIHNGTSTNQFVPVYGYYNDAAYTTQMIYPASDFSSVTGKVITGLRFYLSATPTQLSGTYNVSLTETAATSLSAIIGDHGSNLFSGTLVFEGNDLVVTFSEPYAYEGGNLLVTFDHPTGGSNYAYSAMNFYGTTESAGASIIDGSSVYKYNEQQSFLPKMTFTYAENTDTRQKIEMNIAATATEVRAGNTVTVTATVTTPGYDGEITYSSSNEAIATVNAETGVVTAVAAGNVIITATASNTENFKGTSKGVSIAVSEPGETMEDPYILTSGVAKTMADIYSGHKYYALDVTAAELTGDNKLSIVLAGGYASWTALKVLDPDQTQIAYLNGSTSAEVAISKPGRYIFDNTYAYGGVSLTVTVKSLEPGDDAAHPIIFSAGENTGIVTGKWYSFTAQSTCTHRFMSDYTYYRNIDIYEDPSGTKISASNPSYNWDNYTSYYDVALTAGTTYYIYASDYRSATGILTIARIAETSISAAEYATFVAPFEVTVPADLAFAATKNGATVHLEEVTTIPAGEAVVLHGAAADYKFVETFTSAGALTNDLTSSATDVTADGTQYILAQYGGKVGFHKATVGSTIAAGKGYLVMDAGAKGFFTFDNETTGIKQININDLENAVIYNLQGQRVNNVQRGIYIVNGQKVYIK